MIHLGSDSNINMADVTHWIFVGRIVVFLNPRKMVVFQPLLVQQCSSGGPNKKAIETSCRSSTVSGALSGCYPTILIANIQGNGLISHHP